MECGPAVLSWFIDGTHVVVADTRPVRDRKQMDASRQPPDRKLILLRDWPRKSQKASSYNAFAIVFHRGLLSADSFGDYRMLLTIAYNDMIVLSLVVATLINGTAYR